MFGVHQLATAAVACLSMELSNFYYPTKCWNVATPPIFPLSSCVPNQFSDQQIQALLDQNAIQTVQDLVDKIECARPIIQDGSEDKLRQTLADALERDTPEKALGGKIFVYPRMVSRDALAAYTPESVFVKPDKVDGPIPDFTLVDGPRGSGKSLFAVKRLPELVFPGVDKSEIFCLHLKPSPLLRTMDRMEGLDLPSSVAYYIQEETIAREISGFGNIPPLQLYLHVIIDAITDPLSGFDDQWSHFESKEDLQAIVTALKTMDRYRFAKGVHLTIAGVDLRHAVTDDDKDTIMFRMQPGNKHKPALFSFYS